MSSNENGTQASHYELTTSAYDNVSSLLIALLVLVGATVALLLAVWLTIQIFQKKVAVPVLFEQIGDDGGLGDDSQLDPNVTMPGMETEFEEPELQDTLTAVIDAISNNATVIEDPLWNNGPTGKGGPQGDGRAPGNGTGKPGVRRHWEVRFIEGNTLTTYAQQLDFFGIELGVLLPNGKVRYAYNMVKKEPDSRTSLADDEQRYYLTWQNGALESVDRQLLDRAGIASGGMLVLKFIPRELEGQLAGMEKQYAADMSDKILATYFGVRPQGKGYEFFIDDQVYRH